MSDMINDVKVLYCIATNTIEKVGTFSVYHSGIECMVGTISNLGWASAGAS